MSAAPGRSQASSHRSLQGEGTPVSRVSVADVRTPCLRRAVADYTQVLGFQCLQHVPGVFSRLVHGPLCVQLWACGAVPGRWERPAPGDRGFEPGHHRVDIAGIHALQASLRQAVLGPCRTGLAGRTPLHAHRLAADAPQWQPWGAWETTLTDIDGNVLHLIDRAARRPGAPAPQRPGAEVRG